MGIINGSDFRDGLTSGLQEVFECVSSLECIKGLYLCGGTAQSLQMNHRLSEDLDFELLGTRRDRPELDFNGIIEEVKSVFPDARTEILGEDHFLMYITDRKVKLSFFRPENPVKCINIGFRYNNLVAPSKQDLLGMKLYTICVRSRTRDFYDIFCLLKDGCSLTEGISYASYLSRHGFKSKDMIAKLLTQQMYPMNDEFTKLCPRIDITPEQMKGFFGMVLERETKARNIARTEGILKKDKGPHI